MVTKLCEKNKYKYKYIFVKKFSQKSQFSKFKMLFAQNKILVGVNFTKIGYFKKLGGSQNKVGKKLDICNQKFIKNYKKV